MRVSRAGFSPGRQSRARPSPLGEVSAKDTSPFTPEFAGRAREIGGRRTTLSRLASRSDGVDPRAGGGMAAGRCARVSQHFAAFRRSGRCTFSDPNQPGPFRVSTLDSHLSHGGARRRHPHDRSRPTGPRAAGHTPSGVAGRAPSGRVPAVSRKRALNRLGELVAAGYPGPPQRELPGQRPPQSVYFLTSRGRTALQIRSEEASGWFATRQWRLDLASRRSRIRSSPTACATGSGRSSLPEHLLPPAGVRRASGKRRVRPDAVYETRERHEGDERSGSRSTLATTTAVASSRRSPGGGREPSVLPADRVPDPRARAVARAGASSMRFGRGVWRPPRRQDLRRPPRGRAPGRTTSCGRATTRRSDLTL